MVNLRCRGRVLLHTCCSSEKDILPLLYYHPEYLSLFSVQRHIFSQGGSLRMGFRAICRGYLHVFSDTAARHL